MTVLKTSNMEDFSDLNAKYPISRISRLPSGSIRVIPFKIGENNAFTLIELMMVIAIIAILAGFAVGGIRFYVKKAYNVTLQHDLKNFAAAQDNFFTDNNRYLGSTGDFIQGGDTPTGTIVFPEVNFRPSNGVKIEIISGDGATPQGPPAFTARATHEKASKRYAYNFATDEMTEEEL
jgi:prepilin-type N-terminal cleavage/methylation domain-containing protein